MEINRVKQIDKLQIGESFIIKHKSNEDIINDEVRYLLGKKGNNPIICIGINPSTADDEKPDPTIEHIEKIIKGKYDGWFMVNLFPKRGKNPREVFANKDLFNENNKKLVEEQEKTIKELIKYTNSSCPILAMWGNSVEQYPQLRGVRDNIIEICKGREWFYLDKTVYGNPMHPGRLKTDISLKKGIIKYKPSLVLLD